MESLLDSPVTLLPVFLALVVIASIGAGVIVMVTRSSSRQNRSPYASVGSGQQQVPQEELPWDQRRSEPVPHVSGHDRGGRSSASREHRP